MSRFPTMLSGAAIAGLIAGPALALNPQPLPPRCLPGQGCGGPHPDYQVVHNYNRGETIDRDEGQPVDWRAHHLRAPPRGYEWREVNGQYILAAVATGIILSIILNSGR